MESLTGKIVKNLSPSESVEITKVKPLSGKFAVTYIGVDSRKVANKVLDRTILDRIEIVTEENSFNFTGDPERFKLFAEAERIHSAYQFDPLFAVNSSIVDPLPHQVEAVYHHLLPLPQIRFLLADDTGAGKTIMTGLLLREMMMRSIVERVLIVTPGGLTRQWQESELAFKFNLPFKLVNREAFRSDPTIFTSNPLLVTSIDFIRGEDVINVAGSCSWDMIIVDEAHKLSAFDYGSKRYESQRYKAMERLSNCCEHLLLLTATPHRGRKDTFRNLLQLLDKDIFASDSLVSSRIQSYSMDGVNKFFIRRLKEDMKDWEGNPLFKARHTTTTLYELTPQEKRLYDEVTRYVATRRKRVKEKGNIHVSLALMVLQRRLTSSLEAIRNTLRNRFNALTALLEELNKNPGLWNQKMKYELGMDNLDGFDDMDDDERESLESIFSDPRQFKLFTTAETPTELREEAKQLEELYKHAESLVESGVEEAKYRKLISLFNSDEFADGEKIVIFTEHKDTLNSLERRLTTSGGYDVCTIHGGLSADERQAVQAAFARDAQILIATDAAGEGINLQFCRLLINWDIPWNPNRLEQRMGRIHRYGQKEDVLVFNMVAGNTREGKVMGTLLQKLDIIREQLGDDRVYDVISDVFQDVGLETIVASTFSGEETEFDRVVDFDLTEENISGKIEAKKSVLGTGTIDYRKAKELKEESDERRLQPIFVKIFFEKAFQSLGGAFEEVRPGVFRILSIPEQILKELKNSYNITADLKDLYFSFDKKIFLDLRQSMELDRFVHYINPGNPLFDSLIKVIRSRYREDMLKGTILVSPEEQAPYLAYYVKSQITGVRPEAREQDYIADEQIMMIREDDSGEIGETSPARYLDLLPPLTFAKVVDPPEIVRADRIEEWCFENVTLSQQEAARERIGRDVTLRRTFMKEAFDNILLDLNGEINELQSKLLLGDKRVQEKITKKQQAIAALQKKQVERMARLEMMEELDPRPPEVMGCAWVVPLTRVEYEKSFGMSRDDQAEATAMETAMAFEKMNYRVAEDVSSMNLGYDIRSTDENGLKRYIEVKGRNGTGGVMLSENEFNRLAQLGITAWLYIVHNCASKPSLTVYQDPIKTLPFEKMDKGIQYYTTGRRNS